MGLRSPYDPNFMGPLTEEEQLARQFSPYDKVDLNSVSVGALPQELFQPPQKSAAALQMEKAAQARADKLVQQQLNQYGGEVRQLKQKRMDLMGDPNKDALKLKDFNPLDSSFWKGEFLSKPLPDVDLTGAYQLVDALYGGEGRRSNLAAQYAQDPSRPMSAKERLKAVGQMDERIREAEKDMLKAQVDYAKNKVNSIGRHSDRAEAYMWRNKLTAARMNFDFGNKANDTIGKAFRDAGMDKNLEQNLQAIANLEDGLRPEPDGTIRAQNIKILASQFARTIAAEKGALSDSDVGRMIQSNLSKTLAEMENYIKANPNAKVSGEYVEGMNRLIQTAKRAIVRHRLGQVDHLEKSFQERAKSSPVWNHLMQPGQSAQAQFDQKRLYFQELMPTWDAPFEWEEGYKEYQKKKAAEGRVQAPSAQAPPANEMDALAAEFEAQDR